MHIIITHVYIMYGIFMVKLDVNWARGKFLKSLKFLCNLLTKVHILVMTEAKSGQSWRGPLHCDPDCVLRLYSLLCNVFTFTSLEFDNLPVN